MSGVNTMAAIDLRSRSGGATRRAAWVAFAAVVVLSPFRASIGVIRDLGGSAYPEPAWSLLAVVVTLGLWVLSLAAMPQRVVVGPSFIALPVAGLLAVAWLGLVVSVDPAVTAKEALGLTLVVALGLYIINEIDSVEQVALPVMAMIAIQVVVALGQVAAQRSIGLAFLGEQTLVPADGRISVIAAADGTFTLRGYGLADHPNILGGILAFALITLGGARRLSERWSAARWIILAAGFAALFLTYSRAAWIAYAVGVAVGLVMFARMRDRSSVRRWLAAAGLAVVVAAPLVIATVPSVAARLNAAGPIPAESRSVDERLALAEGAIALFLERPALGIGFGTLPTTMAVSQPGFDSRQPAHLVLLDAAAETGIVGAACYLALSLAPWVALVRMRRRRWTPDLVAASAAVAAVTAVGLFDHYTWTTPAGLIWVALAVGLWVVAYRSAVERPDGGGVA